MTPIGRAGAPTSQLDPSGIMSSGNTEMGITERAAQRWGVSAQTLWGIYGTESSFGANPGTSSAGAQGPMQFEPSTWARYGGGQSVQSFAAAMPAAAHYLHDLGADTNPTSSATIAAVNAYNGNGGGSNPNTSYFQAVLSNATKLKSGAAGAVTTSSVAQAQTPTGNSGSLGSPLSVLSDLMNGDVSGLAATLGMAAVVGVKDMAVGLWDMVGVPLWHRNQNAVWWYWQNVLFPTTGNAAAPGTFQAYQTWPINAAFWGFGYALLFTDPNAPKGQRFKIADPRKSHIAKHVRRLQSAPARRSMVKPGEVKQRTPAKPKERRSTVKVNRVGALNTVRARPVTVTGSVDNGDRAGRYDLNRAAPARSGTREVESSVPIDRTREIIRQRAKAGSARPVAHPVNTGRQRSRPSGRVLAKAPAKVSGNVRH